MRVRDGRRLVSTLVSVQVALACSSSNEVAPNGASGRGAGGADAGAAGNGAAGKGAGGVAGGGRAGDGNAGSSLQSGGRNSGAGGGGEPGDAGMPSTGGRAAGAAGARGGGEAGDVGEGGLGGESSCQEVGAVPTVVPPIVTLLVDGSSSMFETQPQTWAVLYDTLMNPTAGVVKALEDRFVFGFATYRGSQSPTTEGDPACADWTEVLPATENYAAIDAAYAPITWTVNDPVWETPTGHAIRKAAADLVEDEPEPSGGNIILLLTDGNPNTCGAVDPQCGQDNSIAAVQDAFAAGVRLLAVGAGSIIAQPNNGCPSSARCGLLHLQDLANAGVGAPVTPPIGCDDPTSIDCFYRYEACIVGQQLLASYTPGAPDVGTPLVLGSQSAPTPADLARDIIDALNDLASCTIDLGVNVTGDPGQTTVLVGRVTVPHDGSSSGWRLEQNGRALTLTGDACDSFRAGATLGITFACDPGTGLPVAESR